MSFLVNNGKLEVEVDGSDYSKPKESVLTSEGFVKDGWNQLSWTIDFENS